MIVGSRIGIAGKKISTALRRPNRTKSIFQVLVMEFNHFNYKALANKNEKDDFFDNNQMI